MARDAPCEATGTLSDPRNVKTDNLFNLLRRAGRPIDVAIPTPCKGSSANEVVGNWPSSTVAGGHRFRPQLKDEPKVVASRANSSACWGGVTVLTLRCNRPDLTLSRRETNVKPMSALD